MTESEKKAKELIDKFGNLSIDILHTDCEGDAAFASGNPTIKDAKILAILCVDEIILTLNKDIRDLDVVGNVLLDLIDFWRKVKQEIINYKN